MGGRPDEGVGGGLRTWAASICAGRLCSPRGVLAVKRIACVVGTRPEVIKMAPVIRAASAHPACSVVVIATAQHRELLDQALGWFGILADHDLGLMEPDQPVHALMIRALPHLVAVLQAERPDWVLVQGDTTTTFCAALAAFYQRVPVAHVEAGLRTGDLYQPFPEEANRRLTDTLARHCFAPTERARANLLAEGVPAERITVTGNTGIDALRMLLDETPAYPAGVAPPGGCSQIILVTAHRRETFGAPLLAICRAVRRLVEERPNISVIYPIHPNPSVCGPVREHLGGLPRIQLVDPLPYPELVRVMQCATLVLTDSGGIQEEAPYLGKPVLVLRDVTERPEGIEAGVARLVGTEEDRIVAEVSRLLDDRSAYEAMARPLNPYGDGKAAGRILDVVVSS
jgi:UDP-N-acetylglucosamine 2-epimerase (non-hydrolysing)